MNFFNLHYYLFVIAFAKVNISQKFLLYLCIVLDTESQEDSETEEYSGKTKTIIINNLF